MEARARAIERAHKESAWLGWTTASLTAFAYHDPKKMPPLESLTGVKSKPRIMSADEIKAVFANMRARAKET